MMHYHPVMSLSQQSELRKKRSERGLCVKKDKLSQIYRTVDEQQWSHDESHNLNDQLQDRVRPIHVIFCLQTSRKSKLDGRRGKDKDIFIYDSGCVGWQGYETWICRCIWEEHDGGKARKESCLMQNVEGKANPCEGKLQDQYMDRKHQRISGAHAHKHNNKWISSVIPPS